MIYGRLVAFDDFDERALSAAHTRIAEAALAAARIVAAERLPPVFGSNAVDPAAIVEILLKRDENDDRYDLLKAFEQRWALAVVKLIEPVTNPAVAIRDARARGLTVAAIAAALGVTNQTIYARYGDQIVLAR